MIAPWSQLTVVSGGAMPTLVASVRVWASLTASTKTEVSGFSGAVAPKGRFQSPQGRDCSEGLG